MIEVEVRLYASLRRYRTDNPGKVLLPAGSTVLDLLDGLGIPPAEVQTVFVNRRALSREAVLQDGDRVDLFPAVAGG